MRRCFGLPLAAALLTLSCVVEPLPSSIVHDEDRACSADAECVVIEEECPCVMGGSRIAVRADAVDAIAQRHTRNFCPAAVSDHPSCSVTRAACLAGVCELVAP